MLRYHSDSFWLFCPHNALGADLMASLQGLLFYQPENDSSGELLVINSETLQHYDTYTLEGEPISLYVPSSHPMMLYLRALFEQERDLAPMSCSAMDKILATWLPQEM